MARSLRKSKLGPNAPVKLRAMEAADKLVRAAWSTALFATCHWVEAEGTHEEEKARKEMELADALSRPPPAYVAPGVERGAMTAHEIVRIFRDARKLDPL